jgi:FdhD protein
MKPSVTPIAITHIEDRSSLVRQDLLATEEPLEIRVGFGRSDAREQISLTVTMRTPGNDFELALGFLATEGIISSYQQVAGIHYCENIKPEEKGNVIRVELLEDVNVPLDKLHRNFYTSSSCGVCGKSSIDSVRIQSGFSVRQPWTISTEVIHNLPEKLATRQTVFEHTGGLHAVAVFDAGGELISVREDVGRHNAFDKIAGEALMKHTLPFTEKVILLSGRASFELVQKAAITGASMIVAVGAPSSLAVSLAKECGITLVGFARNRKFNIYSEPDRIKLY